MTPRFLPAQAIDPEFVGNTIGPQWCFPGVPRCCLVLPGVAVVLPRIYFPVLPGVGSDGARVCARDSRCCPVLPWCC